MDDLMIEVSGVTKSFGTEKALDNVDLSASRGSVLGLLGHNGAGKTTLVNILSTLLPPTSGSARVAGLDVRQNGEDVRRRIGLTGQYAAVDETLSGKANLVLIARLLGASRAQATTRAGELLELFDLTHAANRKAQTYSGGMRRRLDLAASLVGHPEVIFLDEPTTGLDPAARHGLWEIVSLLVGEGTTVLLTTQYLDEADQLADSIAVLASGMVIASGTAEQLKSRIGRHSVSVTVRDTDDGMRAAEALRRTGLVPTTGESDGLVLTMPVPDSTELARIVRATDEAGVELTGLAYKEPSLDDVYMSLNHSAKSVGQPTDDSTVYEKGAA